MNFEFFNDYKILDSQWKDLNWAGANGFCFDESGKVCIVWENEKGYWTLPGGGKENNESPVETFRREVLEETQCEATDIQYFHCVYAKCFDESGKEISVKENAIIFRYICKLKNIQGFIPRLDNQEIDERKFVTVDELPKYITWLADSENGRESFEKLKIWCKVNEVE
jgi:ADP-ribose pyrophosphatase YjhB (NUDIX family)